MIARFSQNNIFQPPVELDKLTAVVIKDDFGNPLVIAMQEGPNHVWVSTRKDSDFEELANKLGIMKRTALEIINV